MTRWQDRFTLIPAVFIVVRQNEHILLLRRQSTGYMDGWYSLPAGHIDGGETAVAAACREAKEEVGLKFGPGDLRLVHTMHEQAEGHERINLGFEATVLHGEPVNMEPHKCDELRWASADTLPENIVPSVKMLIQKIAAGEPYSDYNFRSM